MTSARGHLKSQLVLDERHRDRLVFTLCFIDWKHVSNTQWLKSLVRGSIGTTVFLSKQGKTFTDFKRPGILEYPYSL